MHEGRRGIDGLREELERQKAFVAKRSPPYERALALLPDVLSGRTGRFVAAAWEHRTFDAWYARPLLLLAALRADARAEGPSHPLHAAFAAEPPDPDAVTAEALAAALDGSRERVYDALAHRVVSTNETSRAIAWLWPAALAGASRGGRVVALVDVGASAGLNLVADALPAPWTADDGVRIEIARDVNASARLGLDLAPLDATSREDQEWLRACVWPGEADRAARLEQALEVFRAARTRPDAPVLTTIRARNVPARLALLSAANPATLVIAYQTVMRDFLAPEERTEYEAGMRAWLATHPPGRTLWVELEEGAAGRDAENPAALTAHVRAPTGEVETLELARCGFHPVRLRVDREKERGLAALLRQSPSAHVTAQP
jgi:hypothetical protein